MWVPVGFGAYPHLVVDWSFPRDDHDPFERIAQLPPPTGSDPRKQHVITRALLKGFAEPGTAGKGWTLSPYDVVTAINAQNLILPAGTAKIGTREYPVRMNSSPEVVDALPLLSTVSSAERPPSTRTTLP